MACCLTGYMYPLLDSFLSRLDPPTSSSVHSVLVDFQCGGGGYLMTAVTALGATCCPLNLLLFALYMATYCPHNVLLFATAPRARYCEQPRVNGVRSDDVVFGWGGPGGYVYQKAYVECFASPKHLAALLRAAKSSPSIT
jgi:hypothetical protein